MAHYAFLNENNIVVNVIVGKNDGEDGKTSKEWETYYANFQGLSCKQTSYNTYGNVHKLGGVPFRKNYAGIGYMYREDIDAFVPPKPFASWTLNNDTGLWESPIPMPDDGGYYVWDEPTISWKKVTEGA